MCLTTYWRKPKIAKEDIICYKRLRRIGDILYSPVMAFEYHKGLNGAQGDPYVNSFQKFWPKPKYFVYGGFLHCYINSVQAVQAVADASRYNLHGDKSVVYECIIPKGAKYYISCDKK